LNAILGGLLNTSVSLSVGDMQSLATAHVSLQNLMVALGAANMQGLLATTVSYQTLMVAMVNALQAGGDTVNAAILQTLAVAIPGGQNITVGDGGQSAPGLLALGLANPNAATTATINAFDALLVAAQIAQRSPDGSLENAPVINVAASVAGLANISLQILNPPALAVGDGGTTTVNGVTNFRTIARTAAVSLNLSLAPLPPLYLGIATISVLSTPVVLTLAVAPGTATLNPVDCESTKAATQATIEVTPGIASVCVGANASCTGSVNVASVSLQGSASLVAITLNSLGPYKFSPGTSPVTINGSSGSFDVTPPPVNSDALGSDLATVSAKLFEQLPTALSVSVLGSSILGDLLTPILSVVTTALTPVLQGVFSLLNTLIVPTLSLLGVQVGTATVHNMSLTCGVSQLVN
jgi:uncharacterized membrane protein